MQKQLATEALPLFVDLDGTLVSTDTLWESLIKLVKQRPYDLMMVPLWLLAGKAKFKAELAKRIIPNPAALPYRKEVLKLVKERRSAGSPIYLATAANEAIANAVADHLGLFDGVLASNDVTNLSGSTKLNEIRRTSEGGDFEYVGDTWVDIPIWDAASKATVVAGSGRMVDDLKQRMPVNEVSAPSRLSPKVLVRAMRCHQWIKNILLFVALILAHRVTDFYGWLSAFCAFCAFSLVASSVYVTNDILDIESDRTHPSKCRRPFAAGELQINQGVFMAFLLFAIGVTFAAATISLFFALLVAAYAAISLLYSLYLKKQPVIDFFLLAFFYAYRVELGGIAVEAPVTQWLRGFALLFFMSLAMVKRYGDLIELKKIGQITAKGRSYTIDDIPLFGAIGGALSCTSILFFTMYVSSEHVTKYYAHPQYLWIMCPLLLYWLFRLWFIAHRGELDNDPIVFALKDCVSYLTAVIAAVVLFVAV